MKKIKIVKVAFIILFVIVMYFLLPYILPIFSVNSFLIISGSMDHYHYEGGQPTFESFWKNKSIEPEDLPFRHGIQEGDLVIVAPSENYGLGDVVSLRTSPESRTTIIHRIYEYNSTHFKDVGDMCMNEEYLRPATLAVKDTTIFLITNPEDLLFEPDRLYEGFAYEFCGHDWMPVSYIEGKAFLALPQSGLLYLLLEGPKEEPSKSNPFN